MKIRSAAIGMLLIIAVLDLRAQTNTFPSTGNAGVGTTGPSAPLEVAANPTSAVPQVRIRPTGVPGSSVSIPSYLDFYSSFDNYPSDQGPRRTASIKSRFTGGVWGTETLIFEVGSNGAADDSGNEPIERMRIAGNGNVGIGTATPGQKLEVNGNILLSNGSGASITFADGTQQSTAWTGSLCGGDYAESVDVSGDRHRYGPGDVLQIDDDNPSRFVKVAEPYSTAVAGVFSTKPGALGRRQTTPKSSDEVPLAMIGIVPVKVTAENGPIRPHDLLVSSSAPGYAMKGTDRNKLVGAVIGKAMGSLDSGTGVIEVLVTLQ